MARAGQGAKITRTSLDKCKNLGVCGAWNDRFEIEQYVGEMGSTIECIRGELR
jgi:hypothetical protein